MRNRDTILGAWDSAAWEFSLVFEGLEDAYLWRRPHPNAPSIGELASHMAIAEHLDFGQTVSSPLITPSTRYFPYGSEADLPVQLGASEVLEEYDKIHRAAVAWIREQGMTMESPFSSSFFAVGATLTWGERIEYMPFHVGYHTGQAFMVRHMFGHETTDN